VAPLKTSVDLGGRFVICIHDKSNDRLVKSGSIVSLFAALPANWTGFRNATRRTMDAYIDA